MIYRTRMVQEQPRRGVMLLEIISCRKGVDSQTKNEEEAMLIDWAYDCYRGYRSDKLVKNDDEARNETGMLERAMKRMGNQNKPWMVSIMEKKNGPERSSIGEEVELITT
uniref:Uncharacterized protein n=1 Tax=Vitis vinifera TaxID=29760 RepID=F6HPV6_VITVI